MEINFYFIDIFIKKFKEKSNILYIIDFLKEVIVL